MTVKRPWGVSKGLVTLPFLQLPIKQLFAPKS